MLPDRQQLLRQAAIAHQQRSLQSTRPYLATAQGYDANRGQLILSVGNGKITAPSLSNGSVGNGSEVMLIGNQATHRPSQPLPLSPIITLPITPKYGTVVPPSDQVFAWTAAVIEYDLEPPYFESEFGYPVPTAKRLRHYIKVGDNLPQLLYTIERTDIPYYFPFPPEFGSDSTTVARFISAFESSFFGNAKHVTLLDANTVLIFDSTEQQWGNSYTVNTVKAWLKNLSSGTLSTYSDSNYIGGGFAYPQDGSPYSWSGFTATYDDWLPSDNYLELTSSVLYSGSEIPLPETPAQLPNVNFPLSRIPFRVATNLGVDGYDHRLWWSDVVGAQFDILTRANSTADVTVAFTQTGNLTGTDLDVLGVTSAKELKKAVGGASFTRLEFLAGTEDWFNQIVIDDATTTYTSVVLTGLKAIA